jgi:hypothetical protein
MVPGTLGTKLMGRVQVAPDARVAGEELLVVSRGHAVPPLLLSQKFAAMLGSVPVVGIGKVNDALPLLATVTVFGLSLLVESTSVEAKLSDGGSLRSISFTEKS